MDSSFKHRLAASVKFGTRACCALFFCAMSRVADIVHDRELSLTEESDTVAEVAGLDVPGIDRLSRRHPQI